MTSGTARAAVPNEVSRAAAACEAGVQRHGAMWKLGSRGGWLLGPVRISAPAAGRGKGKGGVTVEKAQGGTGRDGEGRGGLPSGCAPAC